MDSAKGGIGPGPPIPRESVATQGSKPPGILSETSEDVREAFCPLVGWYLGIDRDRTLR